MPNSGRVTLWPGELATPLTCSRAAPALSEALVTLNSYPTGIVVCDRKPSVYAVAAWLQYLATVASPVRSKKTPD